MGATTRGTRSAIGHRLGNVRDVTLTEQAELLGIYAKHQLADKICERWLYTLSAIPHEHYLNGFELPISHVISTAPAKYDLFGVIEELLRRHQVAHSAPSSGSSPSNQPYLRAQIGPIPMAILVGSVSGLPQMPQAPTLSPNSVE
jgi:hypothetical protein